MATKRQKRELLLDLSTQSMRAAANILPETLDTIPENISDYETVILEFLKGLVRSKTRPKTSQPASSLSLDEVALALALGWARDSTHLWTLSTQSNTITSNFLLPPSYRKSIALYHKRMK